jgi:hypothetical protein
MFGRVKQVDFYMLCQLGLLMAEQIDRVFLSYYSGGYCRGSKLGADFRVY